MTREELAVYLRTMAEHTDASEIMLKAFGGGEDAIDRVRQVSAISKVLFGLAASIVESGHDAVTVIKRLDDIKPWLDATEAEWAERLKSKP
jgi:hypothetical protein